MALPSTNKKAPVAAKAAPAKAKENKNAVAAPNPAVNVQPILNQQQNAPAPIQSTALYRSVYPLA